MNGGPQQARKRIRAASALTVLALVALGPVTACSAHPSSPNTQPVGHTGAAPSPSGPAAGTPYSPAPSDLHGAQPPAGGPAQLDPVVQRLAPYLEHHFGNTYASVLVDSPNNQLVVFRLPDPRLDAAARTIAGRVRLTFVTSRYSYLRQHQIISRIEADRSYWRQHGVTVSEVSTSNGVHCAALVGITGKATAAQRAFDARYGAGVAKVSQIGAVTAI
ncbi:hypothetical protein [Streptacidiphilus sp. EB129]|uniref:hypothetical protein n=1 Tax=Streptacidiphilus sp. EB129 TaxID=3156262 RepID=UPI003515C313